MNWLKEWCAGVVGHREGEAPDRAARLTVRGGHALHVFGRDAGYVAEPPVATGSYAQGDTPAHLKRFWHNFARWVKQGHAQPLPLVLQPIPVESWADRKRDFERAQRAHRGQRDTYAKFRKATNAALIEQIFADADKCERLVDTHPWLFRDPDAFVAAVKATARRRVAEARR